MTAYRAYSEQSHIKIEKYFFDLAVRLIEKGQWKKGEDGFTRRREMTADDIYEVYLQLWHRAGVKIFSL